MTHHTVEPTVDTTAHSPSPYSKDNFQDQSCNLTVGALCSCDADAHPAVSYALFGLGADRMSGQVLPLDLGLIA